MNSPPEESRDRLDADLTALEEELWREQERSSRLGQLERASEMQTDRCRVREVRDLIQNTDLDQFSTAETCCFAILDHVASPPRSHWPSKGTELKITEVVRAVFPDEHISRYEGLKRGRDRAAVFLSYSSPTGSWMRL